MILEFQIDGQKVREPKEYRGIELELNYENINEVQTAITADKFTWVGKEAKLINNYVTQSVLGVFWGIPFKVLKDTNALFDGYIDLTNEADFSCDQVVTKVREAKKLDWLDEVADGFSFDLLADLPPGHPARISDADFIKVPYIISEIPDYRNAALAIISAFVITREIERVVKDIANIVADISGIFNSGGGVIKLIFLVVYITVLIVALIKLIKDFVSELIQPVKYHNGMLVSTHFEKACKYLGFTFSSSIFQDTVATGNELAPGLWKNLLILPEKNKEGVKKNKTSDQVGYFKGTFGDFVRAFIEMFNAKFVITGNTFHFERRDFGSSTQTYKIPDVRRDFHGINANELVSNYLVQFQVDTVDLNTVNRYKGTNAKNFVTSKVKDPAKVELIKGFKQALIPFALGRRKNELTRVEAFLAKFLKVFDKLLTPIYKTVNALIDGIAAAVKVINAIIKVLNKIGLKLKKINTPKSNLTKSAFSESITGRIGMLALSNDLTGQPKVILIEGTGSDVRIPATSEVDLSAENLWNKYHYLESFVVSPNRPAGNQSYIYEIPAMPFCYSDYVKIRGLNNQGEARILSPEGNPAKILSLKWNIWQDKAKIRYKEEKVYATNLQEKLLIDLGL